MTAPFPIQPPKSLDGTSPRELISYERRTPPGEEQLPPGVLGGTPAVMLAISDGNLMTVMLKLGDEPSEWWPHQAAWFPSNELNQVRAIATIATVGSFGSHAFVEYSTDPEDADSWDTPAADGSAVLVQLDAPGPQKGAWVTLHEDAVGDVTWRLRAAGGDSDATPVVGKAHIQFRQATVEPPPNENEPGDYPDPWFWSRTGPDDPMWQDDNGTIAHPRTHNTNVGRWSDKTGNGHHFITHIFASTPPKLSTAVTERGIPSIEFATAVGGFFGQSVSVFDTVEGVQAASIAIRVKMKNVPPSAANRTGYWHYGMNRTSNDTAHPWTNGNHFESFGRSYQINLGSLPGRDFTQWHTYIVAFNHLGTRVVNGVTVSRPYSIYFDGELIVANVTDPTSAGGVGWPTSFVTNFHCYLGRSLSHLGDFYCNEIMGWRVELTPAQAAAVHAHMSVAP